MTSFTGDQCHTDTNHCDEDVTHIKVSYNERVRSMYLSLGHQYCTQQLKLRKDTTCVNGDELFITIMSLL